MYHKKFNRQSDSVKLPVVFSGLFLLLATLLEVVHAQDDIAVTTPVKVNPKCLVKEELRFAGLAEGTYITDEVRLNEFMMTDWRLWGFQTCTRTD